MDYIGIKHLSGLFKVTFSITMENEYFKGHDLNFNIFGGIDRMVKNTLNEIK